MIKKKKLFTKFYTIFGLGKTTINSLYLKSGLNINTGILACKVKHHSKFIRNLKKKVLGKFLKARIKKSILFIGKTAQTYRGIRLLLRYPVRGQRTHTNAKTSRKIKLFSS